jgi:transcriptional regulator with GAF, ATPase, and Fis domain
MAELKAPQFQEDYDFFRQAVYRVSSSLDLSQAMQAAYHFLKQHFPLSALTFHTYEPHLGALHLLFMVTAGGQFQYLDELAPLPEDGQELIHRQEADLKTISIVPSSEKSSVARYHSMAVSGHIAYQDRSYLVSILSSERKTVGHLCLMGPKPDCYTLEHKRRIAILRPAFSLFMMNLLHYREIVELQQRLAEQNRRLAGEVRRLSEGSIIGAEGGLHQVMEMVGQLAGRDVPVLITGETGSGKELVADAIQRVSARHAAPYVKVNCGAIPDTLIDSELFGHEKGAFTGAVNSRPGRFEQADGGTLFLDEVGDMPLQAQVRLLRVLQNNTLERVGSTKSIRVDVRIIAATHRDLEAMVRTGRFREDLYYRINIFPIKLPALRERTQDIPTLIRHFIASKALKLRLNHTPRLASDSMARLMAYAWPGNVRELENLVERALILDPQDPLPLHRYLPKAPPLQAGIVSDGPAVPGSGRAADAVYKPEPLFGVNADTLPKLDQVMIACIGQALDISGGKIHGPGGAAELLGINPNTLRKRMDKLKIPYGKQKRALLRQLPREHILAR